MNFLETLLSQWLEYNGYYVRRNVKVGLRKTGGWEGELDIVAYNPERRRLIHYECSSDSWTLAKRNREFRRKFAIGRKHVPKLFPGLKNLPTLEQQLLHAYASKKQETLGGVKVLLLKDLISKIMNSLGTRPPNKQTVPEQYFLIRALHWAAAVNKKSHR